MALQAFATELVILIAFMGSAVFQQGLASVGSPITSVSPPGTLNQALCGTSAGWTYFKTSPLTAVFGPSTTEVQMHVIGDVKSIKCSNSMVVIHTHDQQTGSYRLYVYDTRSPFNSQNYIPWTTLNFSMISMTDRAALVLLPETDTNGAVVMTILGMESGLVSTTNTKQISLMLTTNRAQMALGSNHNRIAVLSDDVSRPALSVLVKDNNELEIEGDLPEFPASTSRIMEIPGKKKSTLESDMILIGNLSSLSKYLLKPTFSGSGPDATAQHYEYASDQIKRVNTVKFDNFTFILVLHSSGTLRILDKDLKVLNYMDDTSLGQALEIVGVQRDASNLDVYFSFENKTTVGTYDIEGKTFQTCPANCQTCLSSTQCYSTCSAGYYFLPGMNDFGTCYSFSNIPSGLGKINGRFVLENCTDFRCVNCKNDNTVCEQCNTTDANSNPVTYYLRNDSTESTTQNCLLSIPGLYGRDLTQSAFNVVKPCQVSSCVSCESNYLACSRCQSPLLSYTAINGTTGCILLANVPAGWGKNPANLLTVANCADPNCENCTSNSSTCFACTSASSTWLKVQHSGNICADPAVYQDYLGKVSANSSLVPCTDSNCKDCFTDAAQCQICKPPAEVAGAVLLLGNLNGFTRCLVQNQIPAGYFVDNSLKTFTMCQISGCSNCSTSVSECSACSVGKFLYQNTSGTKCLTIQEVMNFTGEDRKRGVNQQIFSQCSANCVECFLNYQVCTTCEANFALFGNETSRSCTNISELPSGYGINSTSGEIQPCVDTLCMECKANNSQCTNCSLVSYFFYINVTSVPPKVGCTKNDAIPLGYGKDVNSGQLLLRKCSFNNSLDQFCISCSSNYQKCTQCMPGYFIQPYENESKARCILDTNISEGYGKNLTLSSSLLVKCSVASCKNCYADYSKCLQCQSGLYLDDSLKRKANSVTCQNITSLAIDSDFSATGVDNISMTVKPCFSNCLNCTFDSSGCTLCQANLYLLKNDTIRSCEVSTFVIGSPGFGLSPISSPIKTIEKCSVAQCSLCPSDFSNCESCKIGYYLHQPQISSPQKNCSGPNLADFPDFHGIVPGSSPPRLTPCTTSGCSANGCKANNSYCTSCSIGYETQFVNQYINYCVNTSVIVPDGFGKDLSNPGTIKPCALSGQNCSKCANNHLICEACNVPLLLNTTNPGNPGSLCLQDSHVNGLGKDLNMTGVLRSCQVGNCLNCYENYLQCSECVSNYLLDRITIPGTSRCMIDTKIVPGAGRNNSSLAFCTDLGCQDCYQNFSLCKTCKSDFVYNPDRVRSLPICLSIEDIPSGYGANTTNYIVPCQDSQCLTCKISNICTACNGSFFLNSNQNCEQCPSGCSRCQNASFCVSCDSGYFIDNFSLSGHQSCRSDSPPGYGKDPASGKLLPCQVSNCQLCGDYYRNCSVCSLPFKALIQTDNSTTCNSINQELPGYGWNSSLDAYVTCAIPNCKRCWNNSQVCSNCSDASTQDYYLRVDGSSTSCLSKDLIPRGLGIDQTEMTLKNCSLENCSLCVDNFSNCTACNFNFSLHIDPDGTQACLPGTVEGYGPNHASGSTVACNNPFCKDCALDFSNCQNCYYGYVTLWQSPSSSLACQQLSSSQPLGPDLEAINSTLASLTPKLRPCVDSERCEDCSLNYLSCQKCKSAFRYYRVNSPQLIFSHVFTKNYSKASFYHCMGTNDPWPYAYGADSVSGSMEIKPCLGNCVSCSANYTVCDRCQITDLISMDGKCVNQATAATLLEQGMDRWPSNGTLKTDILVACQDTNCSNCSYWNIQCTLCKIGYYLNTSTHKCTSQSTLENTSRGPDLSISNKPIVNCSDSRCLNCNQNHSLCRACLPGYLSYLNQTTSAVTCLMRTELIASKQSIGPAEIGSTQLLNCSERCETCFNLYTTCESCKNQSHYLIPDGSSPNCGPLSELIETNTTGRNISGRTVVQCNEATCQQCWQNYQICKTCKQGFTLYPRNADQITACLDASEIPEGKGKSVGSVPEQIEDCLLDGCRLCVADRAVCTACQTTHYTQFYANGTVEACHSTLDTVPVTFGRQDNSTVLKNCKQGCLLCTSNHSECTKCLENWYQFNSQCYQESNTPPSGYGRDRTGTAYVYTPCKVEKNCKECPDHFQVCSICKENYRFDDSGQCILVTSGTPGYGLNGTNLVPCSHNFCSNCSENYQICENCSAGYFGLKNDSVVIECLDILHIPQGFGETKEGKLIPCQVKNCEFCTSDAYGCEYCANHYYLFKNTISTSCLSIPEIPAGLGVLGYNLTNCSATNCSNCAEDINFCLNCTEGFYLERLKSGRKCTNNSNRVNTTELADSVSNDGLADQESHIGTGDSLLKFTVSVATVKSSDLVFRAYDSTSGKVYEDLRVDGFQVQPGGHSISIKFAFADSVSNVNVYIFSRQSTLENPGSSGSTTSRRLLQTNTSSASNPFDQGVLVKGVSYYGSSTTWIKKCGLAISIIIMIVAGLSFIKSSIACYRIVEVSILLGMLNLWSSDSPKIFTEFIYWFRYSLFNVIPFFKFDESIVECTASGPLFFNSYSCFVYNNLARFIPTFFVWLLLATFFKYLSTLRYFNRIASLSTKLDYEVRNKEHARKTLIANMLNFSFVAVLPFFYFATANLYYMNTSVAMKYGFVLSLVIMSYYVTILAFGINQLRNLRDAPSKDDTDLLICLTEGLRLTGSKNAFVKYCRVIEIVRNAVLGVTLALLNDYPLAQSLVALFILSPLFFYLFFSKSYESDALRRFISIKEFLIIGKSILFCVLTSNKLSSDTRHIELGFIQIAMTLSISLACIYFGLQLLLTRSSPKSITTTD